MKKSERILGRNSRRNQKSSALAYEQSVSHGLKNLTALAYEQSVSHGLKNLTRTKELLALLPTKDQKFLQFQADFRRFVAAAFITTTVCEQHRRSHHKCATDANATGGNGRDLIAGPADSCPFLFLFLIDAFDALLPFPSERCWPSLFYLLNPFT